MRILVTGDREWDDDGCVIDYILDGYEANWASVVVIEGCARGADHEACDRKAKDDPGHFPADWDKYGKAAGPIRNQQMLDEGKPDVVWAFHDDLKSSKGTKDMVTRALKAGLPVYLVSRPRLEDLT